MGRSFEFHDKDCVLFLSGLQEIFSLKRKVVIPYSSISNVTADRFKAPLWMLRMPGTSLAPLNIYEGSFLYRNEWYFLSYENRDLLVIIELHNHPYRYVVFESNDAIKVVEELRKRIKNVKEMQKQID